MRQLPTDRPARDAARFLGQPAKARSKSMVTKSGCRNGPHRQNATRRVPWYHLVGTKAKSRESLTPGYGSKGSSAHLTVAEHGSQTPGFHDQGADDQKNQPPVCILVEAAQPETTSTTLQEWFACSRAGPREIARNPSVGYRIFINPARPTVKKYKAVRLSHSLRARGGANRLHR